VTDETLVAKLVRGPTPVRVELAEHIGSTAVPGLAAKPIVDVVVGIDDPDDEPAYVPDLQSLGGGRQLLRRGQAAGDRGDPAARRVGRMSGQRRR
jgi:GrpB-like predicted nucleotidyltransferase (UPF0157 family)